MAELDFNLKSVAIVRHVAFDGTVFDQNKIFHYGQLVGFCGLTANLPINLIREVSANLEKEILDEVDKAIGTPSKTSHAPVLVEDPELDDDE